MTSSESRQENPVLPSTLYKYRDWSNPFHRRMLTHREVYFPSPTSLNDAFDAAYHPEVSQGGADREIEKKLFKSLPEVDSESRRLIAKALTPWASSALQANAWNVLITNNATGVAAFSSTAREPVMWSHYARNHHGFCIGFDTQKLLDYLESLKDDEFELHPVTYASERQAWNSTDTPVKLVLLEQLTVKSKGWSYEREYRIISFKGPESLIALPEGVIKEVVLGYRMPVSQRRAILTLAESFPEVKTYQAIRRHQTFAIDLGTPAEQVLPNDQEFADRESQAIQFSNMGIAAKQRGDLDLAEKMQRKSLSIEKQMGNRAGMAADYGNLANIYQLRGDLQTAEALYWRALELLKKMNTDPSKIAEKYIGLALMMQLGGDEDRWHKYLQMARKIYVDQDMIEQVNQIDAGVDAWQALTED
ncbi:MAG: DUF2971 domain-containing protein [Planctomycetota bacterium]|nr:MAG: DUF2971 domain-containing protein [Planctomycetota bacterium]